MFPPAQAPSSRIKTAFWCDVNNPMEPWELESSLALRRLDGLGQNKIDYDSGFCPAANQWKFLLYHHFISFAAL